MIKTLSLKDQETLASRFGYSSWDRYKSRAQFLFRDIDLKDKRVCDIGCGKGPWAIWCALHGGRSVGIEPEEDGSTSGTLQAFEDTVTLFGLQSTVRYENEIMERFLQNEKGFDVVILFNVINHLDESAVERLHFDRNAVKQYIEKFELLRSSMNAGGILILSDCARSNFWDKLHLISPLARNIEWNKHQDPDIWANIARDAGFECIDLRWSYLYPFKNITSNWFTSYLTSSDFVMRLRAV